MSKVNLIWTMPVGIASVDATGNTALSESLKNVIDTGEPFSRLVMVFLQLAENDFRWLGVFTETRGQRVSYFPGFAERLDRVKGHRGKHFQWNRGFHHVTLEPNRTRWHVTSDGRAEHQGGPTTLQLSENRILWFGMSVQDGTVFRPASQQTEVTFDAPASDAQRRMGIITAARKDAQFPIISLHPRDLTPSEGTFLHFGFIVGPAGFSHYSGAELGFPIGSPHLATPFPEKLEGLAVRAHRVQLSQTTDLEIIACRIPGALNTPVTFTSPTADQTIPQS